MRGGWQGLALPIENNPPAVHCYGAHWRGELLAGVRHTRVRPEGASYQCGVAKIVIARRSLAVPRGPAIIVAVGTNRVCRENDVNRINGPAYGTAPSPLARVGGRSPWTEGAPEKGRVPEVVPPRYRDTIPTYRGPISSDRPGRIHDAP